MAYVGNQAQIPLGQLGLLTDVPSGEVPRGALIRANNVEFAAGYLEKARGSLRYNTQVLPSAIVAIFDWWPNTSTQRLIAACANGSIYRDTGDRLFNGATAIASGLGTLTPRSMFVEGGSETALRDKKLFFFSGTSQVKVLAGDAETFTTVANPAADWVTPNFLTCGLIHRNRLWAFMKQRAYASDSGNHENQTTNNLTQAIFPGEGGAISGAFVFKGRLFVFKDGGFVYYLDDADTDSDNWVWRKIANNFGLASPHGIVEIGNDMYAVNESGSPTSYSAVQQLGQIESADVLRLMQIEEYIKRVTSIAGVEMTHALYYEAKKQLFITGRSSHRSTNNSLLHIDFNKENARAALWSKDQADCLALRKDINNILRPIYGSADGYVYLMDREDRLVGGSAYTAEFMLGHSDLRFLDEKLANKNKLFDYLAIEFKPQGSWNLIVDVYIDGKFSETINYLMNVRDDGLGSFTLGSDPLGRSETQTIQQPIHGSGRRISFLCRGTGANQNFALASLTIGFRTSAEQATRV